MAPLQDAAASLVGRGICSSGYYYDGRFCVRRSSWYFWGRWVVVGVLIFVFFLFLLILNRNRRRRIRNGQRPLQGTGWMGMGKYNNPAPNYPPPQYSPQPPPQNAPAYTGGTFNSNQGYYGGPNDVPLQQPPNAYYPSREVNDDYAPPAGPPPGKR